jgi:hypothetical protein
LYSYLLYPENTIYNTQLSELYRELELIKFDETRIYTFFLSDKEKINYIGVDEKMVFQQAKLNLEVRDLKDKIEEIQQLIVNRDKLLQ